jgi:hypothetical protein
LLGLGHQREAHGYMVTRMAAIDLPNSSRPLNNMATQ